MSTKLLRKTARRLIREYDEFQDAYPSLLRSSDPLNNGENDQSSFSDNKTIVFSTNYTSFPSMTPAGSSNLASSSITQNVEITPQSVENRPRLPGSIESATPFNESQFDILGTADYITTSSLAYGFTSAARNKIAIPIDITPTQEKLLCRLNVSEVNSNPNSEFYGNPSTGFCYYNFSTKRWEDIGFGLAPSYLGNMLKFSGHRYFMSQFQGTSNLAHIQNAYGLSQSSMNSVGYKSIGSPTMFFDAPNASRYHATSSQMLPLSSYIHQPFMLERVDVTLPFVAKRSHGQTDAIMGYKQGALRDIDNLVFFMYRQENGPSDQVPLRSNSRRFLITNGSLTFYNGRVNQNVSFTTHNPAFSYDHDLPLSNVVSSVYTGSITFSIYPKDYPTQFGGLTSFGSNAYATTTNLVEVMNFWPGSMQTVATASSDAAVDNAGFFVYRKKNAPGAGVDFGQLAFESNVLSDTRFLKRAPGNLLPMNGITSQDFPENINTPYLLLPSDNIIFGIEADICTVLPTASLSSPYGYDDSYLSQTGSFFKLLAQKAQVTLYGSLIQNGVSKVHNSINQNLISPALHEIITNVQDDADQFDVAARSTFYGNYIDNYVSGSIFDGTRRVFASLTNDNTVLSGSFERFVSLVDNSKTYYQNGPTTITIGSYPFAYSFDIAYSSPIQPKNYFRYDRYGNYRDMLEQSKDSRIFDKSLYKKNGGFEDYGPAYAKFVLSSSEIPTTASLTFCNNLNPYMTATFPFDDTAITSTSRGPYPALITNSQFIPSTLIFKT